ncbi:MAG: hypothetical protein EXR11_13185, partial [Rhodospirillaceae bacterium]|nr:hypothetical protein [Rhodospirillaceae bacterium]
MLRIWPIAIAAFALNIGAAIAQPKMSPADVAKSASLIESWIGGNYSTQVQHEADQASDKPDNEKHRLMFQLFR